MTKLAPAAFSRDFMTAELSDGTALRFTPTEQRLLTFFSKNNGDIVTRDTLLLTLHKDDAAKGTRSIDFIINRLRLKLRDDPKDPRFIITHYGKGYEWQGGTCV